MFSLDHRPPKEFNDGCLWKLKKNVYGLNDAARAHLKAVLLGLGMKISHLDPALFFWWHGNILAGVMCIHVDDILWAGTSVFYKCCGVYETGASCWQIK